MIEDCAEALEASGIAKKLGDGEAQLSVYLEIKLFQPERAG